jgi:CheY-like chemotaxis protein
METVDVLIIDDDQDIRDTLASVVELQGHTVVTASNGSEALQMLREGTAYPRMIFLDLRMPVMNGWQFLEQFSQLPNASKIPVVVITADRSAATRKLDGIAGFLLKPLEVSDIMSVIGQHAEGATADHRP